MSSSDLGRRSSFGNTLNGYSPEKPLLQLLREAGYRVRSDTVMTAVKESPRRKLG